MPAQYGKMASKKKDRGKSGQVYDSRIFLSEKMVQYLFKLLIIADTGPGKTRHLPIHPFLILYCFWTSLE